MKLISQLTIIFLLLTNGDFLEGRQIYGTFDYIIVGGGTAGSVVATILTEETNKKVLLIEAGENSKQDRSDVPLAAATLQRNSKYNYGYSSVPDGKNCLGMEDNRCSYPQGRSLGGTSQISGMLYVRGSPSDFDEWEEEGCTGWGYTNLLEHFKDAEQYCSAGGMEGPYDCASHGDKGPIMTEYPRHRSPFSQCFVKGGQENGMSYIDYNSNSPLVGRSVSYVQANTAYGRREDAGTEYVRKRAERRSNFFATYNSMVTQLIFEENTAVGVLFEKDGNIYEALTKEEVILCAGVLNSPKILMLSGIGPRETLEAKNIEVIQDLPVGQYMTDHVSYFGFTCTTNTVGQSPNYQTSFQPLAMSSWSLFGNSQLSVPYAIEALAFSRLPDSELPNGQPEVELLFTPSSYADKDRIIAKNHRISDKTYEKLFSKLEKNPHDKISVYIVNLHPKSIGNVTIADNKPSSAPVIHPNSFSDPDGHDLRVMVHGIREAQKIFKSQCFEKYELQPHKLDIEACNALANDSDDYWKCCFRYLATSLHHMVGTCRMGAENDPTAVVTPDFRVKGIRKLKVCDSSVIRKATSGHPLPVVLALAKICGKITAGI